MNPFDRALSQLNCPSTQSKTQWDNPSLVPEVSLSDSKTEEEAYVIHTAVLRQAVMDITALSEADAQLAIRIRSTSGADPVFEKWINFAAAARWIFADPPVPAELPERIAAFGEGSRPDYKPILGGPSSEGVYYFSYASICESLGVPLETTRERVFSYLGKLAGGLLCSISGPGYARFVNPGKAKQIPQKAPARQKAPATAPHPRAQEKDAA